MGGGPQDQLCLEVRSYAFLKSISPWCTVCWVRDTLIISTHCMLYRMDMQRSCYNVNRFGLLLYIKKMAQERLSIAIGSLNPVKINAVRSALVRARISADVRGVDVPSGVSAMPIGFAETMSGAQQRAALARATFGTDWGVGMEGGVEF